MLLSVLLLPLVGLCARAAPADGVDAAANATSDNRCTKWQEWYSGGRWTYVEAQFCLLNRDDSTYLTMEQKEGWYYWGAAWYRAGRYDMSWEYTATVDGKVYEDQGTSKNGIGYYEKTLNRKLYGKIAVSINKYNQRGPYWDDEPFGQAVSWNADLGNAPAVTTSTTSSTKVRPPYVSTTSSTKFRPPYASTTSSTKVRPPYASSASSASSTSSSNTISIIDPSTTFEEAISTAPPATMPASVTSSAPAPHNTTVTLTIDGTVTICTTTICTAGCVGPTLTNTGVNTITSTIDGVVHTIICEGAACIVPFQTQAVQTQAVQTQAVQTQAVQTQAVQTQPAAKVRNDTNAIASRTKAAIPPSNAIQTSAVVTAGASAVALGAGALVAAAALQIFAL